MNKPDVTPLTPTEQLVLVKLARSGNQAARKKLIESNFRFVFKATTTLIPFENPKFDDCVQEGLIGLNYAIDKYELGSNRGFLSYAVYWIRSYITKYLREFNNGLPFRIPENQATKLYSKKINNSLQLTQCIGGYYRKDSCDSDPAFQELLQYHVNNDPIKKSDNDVFESIPTGPIINDLDETAKLLESLDLTGLTAREDYVIKRSKLSSNNCIIASEIGISKERVRQIKNNAIEKIRKNNKDLIGTIYEEKIRETKDGRRNSRSKRKSSS